ncbi:MAG: hypothetical protein WC477_01440 [Patescibacteria group bacterium]
MQERSFAFTQIRSQSAIVLYVYVYGSGVVSDLDELTRMSDSLICRLPADFCVEINSRIRTLWNGQRKITSVEMGIIFSLDRTEVVSKLMSREFQKGLGSLTLEPLHRQAQPRLSLTTLIILSIFKGVRLLYRLFRPVPRFASS